MNKVYLCYFHFNPCINKPQNTQVMVVGLPFSRRLNNADPKPEPEPEPEPIE